ncbi:MAG: hypothetical protein ACAH22_00065 [Tardiphaga sp.]
MAIRSSNFYNDPAFAQAASNLSSLFAPPSGADASGWASANAKNAEAKRLAEIYASAADPAFNQQTFDRRNIAVGNYNPTQSYYAQDQNNSTAVRAQDVSAATLRRGQDIQASTSRANNAQDNQRSLIGSIYGALNEGQVRPAIPESIASLYQLPAIPAAAGTPKPLSESEWKAGQNQRLLDTGGINDQMLIDALVGDKAPVQSVGPDGKTGMFMSPGAAVRQGAQPYDKPAATSLEGDNYLAAGPDGKEIRFVGRPDASGRIIDVNTGQVVPNVIRKEGTGGGMSVTADGRGGFTVATGNAAGKSTDAQDRAAYAAKMSEDPAKDVITAFDTGALPNATDYQLSTAMRQLPPNVAPLLNGQLTPQGQKFYQGLRSALPYQLMVQSGQAVTEQEYDRKLLELSPVPGDTPDTLALKKRQFQSYLTAVRGLAGPAYNKTHPGAPAAGAPPAASPQVDLLQQARDAIQRGAPREQVIQRLRQNGIDPAGL